MTLQPQWEVASSVFDITKGTLGLIRAATVDDVQPAAVNAVEALGSHMIVDPHLIGIAYNALGGKKSYKIENLKLHFGLSTDGVASQIRKSPSATRAFLLITVLKAHLKAPEIADVLYELIVQTNVLDLIPISNTQLCAFVRSVEGHCLSIDPYEDIDEKVIGPLVNNLALHNDCNHDYWHSFIPNEVSPLIMSAFNALKDESIQQLKISGKRSGIWLAVILCWLFPNGVAVVNASGELVVGNSTAKIVIALRHVDESKMWSMEHWYVANQMSEVVVIKPTEEYARISMPVSVSSDLAYATSALSSKCPLRPDDLEMVRTLSTGLILAVLYYTKIQRRTDHMEQRDYTDPLYFRDICWRSFEQDMGKLFIRLGWPPTSDGLDDTAHSISQYFGRREFAKVPKEGDRWLETIKDVDNRYVSGKLGMKVRRETQNIRVVYLSLHISNTLLGQATQRADTGSQMYPLLKDYSGWTVKCFLTEHLLSDTSPTISATEYFNYTMYSVNHGPQFQRDPGFDIGGKDVLATSFAGQVAFRQGLFEVPQIPVETFEIIVVPGKLLWQGNPKDCHEDAGYGEETDRGAAHKTTYSLFEDDDAPLKKKTAPLRILQTPNFVASVTINNHNPIIKLRYRFPSTGDQYASFSKALTNFALAPAATASSMPLADILDHPTFRKLRKLQFKRPGSSYLLEDEMAGERDVRAVASYSGNKMADFLRFGTEDATNLRCIIQDSASIHECVIQAEELYGSHWLIMANP